MCRYLGGAVTGLLTLLICHEFWSHLTSLPQSVASYKVIENIHQGEYHREVQCNTIHPNIQKQSQISAFFKCFNTSQDTWIIEDTIMLKEMNTQ